MALSGSEPDGGLARLDKDGNWQTYTKANTSGGVPADKVLALVSSVDGALWVGTVGGLARLDKDGHWQTYTKANTGGGLPADVVLALASGADGALWVGTSGGLGHLRRSPTPTHAITEVIGDIRIITQPAQTVAVVAYDHSQLTRPFMFHYVWRLTERRLFGDQSGPEVRTKTPVFTAHFKHDGAYRLSVVAIDRYGMWSKPREIDFSVAIPKPDPLLDRLVSIATWLVSTGILYFMAIFPLILLYPRFSWARTATNSGVFTKFPFLHKTILGTRWARRRLFRQYTRNAIAGAAVPAPYIPQSLFAEKDKDAQALTRDGGSESLVGMFAAQRRALLIARSGTGKSVFLRHLLRAVGTRFLNGERAPLPVLIDLRTHVLTGRAVQDLVLDALRGGGVELSDGDLAFLIAKGGFLILVDSLNELPNPADAQLFHTFFNRDAHNLTLIASQLDLIRRDDMRRFNLAAVTPEQAARYLEAATGRDIYADLPPEAQALARNPQDLAFLAEVAQNAWRRTGADAPGRTLQRHSEQRRLAAPMGREQRPAPGDHLCPGLSHDCGAAGARGRSAPRLDRRRARRHRRRCRDYRQGDPGEPAVPQRGETRHPRPRATADRFQSRTDRQVPRGSPSAPPDRARPRRSGRQLRPVGR